MASFAFFHEPEILTNPIAFNARQSLTTCIIMMKATKEKDRQSFEYVEVEGNMFKLEHVVGDGNCFFYSISKSPYVSANHTELRFMLVDYICI